ncbi:MAG: hypothetical protein OXU36_02630 [Candidatus Poribacteria bacterium]|nr:hypothetical protein [Candidatus Poribacteria bacterium]
MQKATLETIVQRLDRLEKMITEVNEQFSWLVEKLVPDVPKNSEAAAALRGAEVLKNSKREAHIAEEILDEIFEKMGIPPDFDPGSIEDLHESMRQHGIRAEDNEFSRAIIAEREK